MELYCVGYLLKQRTVCVIKVWGYAEILLWVAQGENLRRILAVVIFFVFFSLLMTLQVDNCRIQHFV